MFKKKTLEENALQIIDRKSKNVNPIYRVKSAIFDLVFSIIVILCAFILMISGFKVEYFEQVNRLITAINEGNNSLIIMSFIFISIGIYLLVVALNSLLSAIWEKRILDRYVKLQ